MWWWRRGWGCGGDVGEERRREDKSIRGVLKESGRVSESNGGGCESQMRGGFEKRSYGH